MWQMHIREVGCHTAGRCWDITTMGMLQKPEQNKIRCLENWADIEIITWLSEEWCWGELQFLNNMQSGVVSVKQVLELQVELFTFVPKGRSLSVFFVRVWAWGESPVPQRHPLLLEMELQSAARAAPSWPLSLLLQSSICFLSLGFKSQALQQSPQRALRQFIKAGGRKNML